MIEPIFCRSRWWVTLLAIAIAASAGQAYGEDQDSVWRAIAKKTGIATDVDPPADFVVKARPAEPEGPLPVFRTPDEPASKILTHSQLKAMDADLDNAIKKHDVLRAGFAPSAKAVAEAKALAAEKAKRGKKPPDAPGKPTP